MNRKQFAVIAVLHYGDFFNEAFDHGKLNTLCMLRALLILRNLGAAYMVERLLSAIEKKEINKRERKKIKPLKRVLSKVYNCR